MFSTTDNVQYEKKEHCSWSVYHVVDMLPHGSTCYHMLPHVYHVVNTLHSLKKKKNNLIQGGRYYFLQFYR